MLEVIDDIKSIGVIKDSWYEIEQNGQLRIFQTYDWCVSAWEKILSKDSNNKLWILKWFQDGKDDVVIFPFYIDGVGALRFIFDTHNDNNDAVYSSNKVNRHFVFKEVAEEIVKEPRIKSVWLQKMRGESEVLNYLSVFLLGAAVSKDNAFAYINIGRAGDFVASQEQFRSENRKHWRKLLKQAEARDYRVFSSVNGDEFPKADVITLRDEMIKSGNRSFGFVTDEMIDLVEEMFKLGKCEVPTFYKEGKLISLEFRLLKGDYSLDWIYLTTDPRTGTEINVKYCNERAKTQTGTIDFGVGAYEYKILTTRPMVGVTFSLRMGKTMVAHFKVMFQAGMRMLKDYVKARKK